jgi:transcriptional pleiotropic regulator of transition state genes
MKRGGDDMKSLGVISGLDNNGSVILPELLLGICKVGNGDALELQLEGNTIVMRKYPPVCIFCGSGKAIKEYRNKSYCSCCADELKNYKR